MLYVGNFSYSDVNEQFDNICLMPAIVEAPDSDAALELFKGMLRELHDGSSLVHGAQDIYLDSLIELDESPTEPLVVQWQKITSSDDGLYSTLSALPRNEEIAEAYAWSADDELVELEPDDDEMDFDVGDLADAITDAFSALTAEDDALAQDEEAFLTFG